MHFYLKSKTELATPSLKQTNTHHKMVMATVSDVVKISRYDIKCRYFLQLKTLSADSFDTKGRKRKIQLINILIIMIYYDSCYTITESRIKT
ncbi:CLUMA_CG013204, isoform A [Clunio marinus]|uniref:CLUMA_CG013204, isoform A n=1 Tax=Clunio marinus TaxID=568069 RepID=A0A1J1II25_9DIPT|nr:CLUMA_CG013204, isoform A [Clunio marinus]